MHLNLKATLLLIALCTVLALTAKATSYTWAQSYGVGSFDIAGQPSDDPFYNSGSDFPAGLAQMPDGGVVVAGQLDLPKLYFNCYSNGTSSHADATLVRYGSDGAIIWQRTLHQTNEKIEGGYYYPAPSRIYQILTDANGNIFVVGGKGNTSNLGQSPFVAKFSADGNLVWQNGIEKAVATIGDPAQNVDCGIGTAYYMGLTNDGGVVLSASQSRPNVGYSIPTLAKFDANGSLVLYAAYEHPQQYMGSLPVCQSRDGTKFVMLAQYPYNDFSASWGATAIVTDASGNIVAERSFAPDSLRSEIPRAIIATADGGFATLSLNGTSGVVVRKFNGDLSTEVFEKVITRSRFFTASSLMETPDGGLLVGGHTSAPNGSAGGGGEEAALMKLKSDGSLDFVSLLGGSNSEMYDDGIAIGCNAIQTPDGGYAFTVATRSYAIDASARKTDWWIVKTDSSRKVQNFGDLMFDQPLDVYTVTDTTRTPTDITAFSRVTYPLSAQTNIAPTFNIQDTGAYSAPDKPTVVFQAAAVAIVPPGPALAFSAIGPVSAGASMQFSATTATGWNVRVQTTTTPETEASWVDLNDDNSGQMTENSPGHYTLDSAAYPPGSAIYFRAIASKAGETDLLSLASDPFSLQQATLRIAASVTSTSDAVNGHFAHNGDDIVYTLTFTNTNSILAKNLRVSTTVPSYIENQTNLRKQFASAELLISPGGTYNPATAPNANDATIVWDVGDLGGGLQNFVRFTVHPLSNTVRTEQLLNLPNDYAVYSASHQPPGRSTGFTSGAPNIQTHVEGPIKMTLVAQSTTVAPGGQFTYRFTLQNLGATTAAHALAVVVQPEFTRFIAPVIFSNTPPVTKKKPKVPPFVPTAKLVYVAGQSDPQVVMNVGPLNPNQTVTIDVTFQTQWADPAEVPKIRSIDYGAAFLTDTAYTSFTTAYANAVTLPDFGGGTDFFAFMINPTNIIALSQDDSGAVNVTLQGSLDNQPRLALDKTISSANNSIADDTSATASQTVRPGGQLTFLLGTVNKGKSEATDVYIQDRMPDHATLVANSARIVTVVDGNAQPPPPPPKKKPKKTPPPPAPPNTGTLRIVPDPDHHHLRFAGLNLPPKVGLVVQYTVQIDSGVNAPAAGTLINVDEPVTHDPAASPRIPSSVSSIGSSITPHTPIGFYAAGKIEVIGDVQFSQPKVQALVTGPRVADDIGAAANAMTAVYNQTPGAAPAFDPVSKQWLLNGAPYKAQRYYVHYENAGTVAANGVTLDFLLPSHTAFYRASFVSLSLDGPIGKTGELIATPAGSTIASPQFLSTGGTVNFTFTQLPASAKGDVMVEVINTPDGVEQTGSFVGDPATLIATIRDNMATTSTPRVPTPLLAAAVEQQSPRLSGLLDFLSPHKAVQRTTPILIELPPQVPKLGYKVTAPQEVKAGQNFQLQIQVMNYGEVGVSPYIDIPIPKNATFVSAEAGQGQVITPAQNEVDGLLTVAIARDNGPTNVPAPDSGWLPPHTTGVINVTLQATGLPGADINSDTIRAYLFFAGRIYAPSVKTRIVPNVLIGGVLSATLSAISGPPLTQVFFNNGIASGTTVDLFDVGGGNIVASGAGNIVATGGGNIVASGGGNIVATGGGNVVTVGTTNGGNLIAHGNEIVASGGGNILVPQGSTIVASGGGNIVASGGGNIVASGGGNIVASGGGNIISTQGGGFAPPTPAIAPLFGNALGQIVASGGGNIVATGGGNIVASGGGNIVASGGGNIISTQGAGVMSSAPGSAATLRGPDDHIVATGGGNIVATGSGN